MTVFKVAVVASPGGTSSESSIARHRPGRGDLRRSEFGGQRRVDGGGNAGLAARPRGADQFDAATGGPGWWRAAGTQGVDAGGDDPRGRVAHRSRERVAGGGDPAG